MAVTEIYLGNAVADNITRAYLGSTLIYTRSSIDAATQALLDQATLDGYSPAHGTVLTALDTFITSLKTAGIWNLCDVLWLPATNGDSDFACYNLKNPASFKLTKVNSPTFTSLQGFTGNGSTAYLDTGFNPSLHGVNFTQNEAGMGIYIRNLGTVTSHSWMGATRSDNLGLQTLINRGSSIFNRVNTGAITDNDSGLFVGFHHGKRVDASNVQAYRNGSLIDTATQGSITPNQAWTILTARIAGGAISTGRTDGQFSFAFGGASLDGLELDLYNAIQTYMTALGTQV